MPGIARVLGSPVLHSAMLHRKGAYCRFIFRFPCWLTGVLMLASSGLVSGQNCHIHLFGYIRDTSTAAPLSYTSVYIPETGQGALADEQGYFHLEGLCPGDYTIQATRIGYQDYVRRFNIQKDTGINIQMNQTGVQLDRVEIRGLRVREDSHASQTLDGLALDAGKGLGLAESLKAIPGVSSLNTGSTIAKPVIQGLHSNRIVILNNGVRQEGQQWGSEHAPEIDPFTAQQATVIKGAGSVRYGSDALGGVILLRPAPLPEQPGLGGNLQWQGLSNGQGSIASGMLEARLPWSKLPLAGRIQGTLKRSGNLRTPDYFLQNTGLSESNFSWTLRSDHDRWYSEAYYSRYYSQVGILRDAHIGNLSDLSAAILRGRPLDDGRFSYSIDRPQQRILHELLRWTTELELGDKSRFQWQLSRQFNRRFEYDAHRQFNTLPSDFGLPQISLEITTYRIEADLEQHLWKTLELHSGVNGMSQRNTTDRGGLIPAYRNYVGGIYWTGAWKNYPAPLEVEWGLRYDLQHLSAGPFEKDTSIQNRLFRNFSGSFGTVYTLSKASKLRFNSGTAWRAPHVSEMYSEGVHHGSASFEQGNQALQPERAWNNSLTFEWSSPRGQANLFISGYYNLIRQFIYLQPMPAPVLTIRGAFPGFRYTQADARLSGLDARLSTHVGNRWLLESQTSIVQGWNRRDKEYLIYMPPVQFRYTARYSLNLEALPCPERYVQLTAIHVLRQRWVPDGVDYTPPPDGYLRLDAEAAYTTHIRKQHLEIGLSVLNLLNTRYRDYLNRLRYFAEEPGRNLVIRIRLPLSF